MKYVIKNVDYDYMPKWVWKIIDKVTSMKHIPYRNWMSPELWDADVASGTIDENEEGASNHENQ